MEFVTLVKGDILNAKEIHIAQQCNCLTVTSHGLSKTLADAFPWADPYKTRKRIGRRNCAVLEDRDVPGSIRVLRPPPLLVSVEKTVICMFAQWGPSKPGKYTSYPEWEKDTAENRVKWFSECLTEIGARASIKELAMPYRIGCGLAGGDWNVYYKMICEFAEKYKIHVKIYKLD